MRRSCVQFPSSSVWCSTSSLIHRGRNTARWSCPEWLEFVRGGLGGPCSCCCCWGRRRLQWRAFCKPWVSSCASSRYWRFSSRETSWGDMARKKSRRRSRLGSLEGWFVVLIVFSSHPWPFWFVCFLIYYNILCILCRNISFHVCIKQKFEKNN